MASNSLLSSKRFNRVQVDKLEVQDIQAKEILSNDISSQTPSYLFSLSFNGTFERDTEGGNLTIVHSDINSIIQFTDRPLREESNIDINLFVA